jgi:hypothetical protein
MEFVVAQLQVDIRDNHQYAGQANAQSGYVDKRINLVID